MVRNSRQLVVGAYKNKKAIGAFNAHNLEIFEAIITAARAKKSPVIIQITPKTAKHLPLRYFKKMAEAAEKIYPEVDFALHLDHGDSLEIVSEALELGFSSVMFDGSHLPFEKNVKLTRQVKKIASRFRVAVEAELGEMPKTGERLKKSTFLDVELIKKFLKSTKVDFLAVPLGTKHGMPSPGGEEHINFDYLKEIGPELHIPLVLHGASGVAKRELKKARRYGVAKVNFDTALRRIFTYVLRKYLGSHPEEEDLRRYLKEARIATKKLVEDKIEVLFG